MKAVLIFLSHSDWAQKVQFCSAVLVVAHLTCAAFSFHTVMHISGSLGSFWPYKNVFLSLIWIGAKKKALLRHRTENRLTTCFVTAIPTCNLSLEWWYSSHSRIQLLYKVTVVLIPTLTETDSLTFNNNTTDTMVTHTLLCFCHIPQQQNHCSLCYYSNRRAS